MLKSISSLFCTHPPRLHSEENETNDANSKFLGTFLKYSSIQSVEIYGYKILHNSIHDYVVNDDRFFNFFKVLLSYTKFW